MKNKIKSMVSAATVLALSAPVMVFAEGTATVTPIETGMTNAGKSGLSNKPLYELAVTAMNWLLGAIGVFAVIAFAISGVLYLTAAGDDDRIKQAKTVMTTAITGVVVAMVGLIVLTAAKAFLGGGAQNEI
jgi:hypothetical protein